MSNEINWAGLKAQNRVKDINIPWTNEEIELIKSGANPEDVRAGKVKPSTPSVSKKAGGDDNLDTGPKLKSLKKDELLQKAKDLGIEVAEDATKAEIIEAITNSNQP